MIQSQAIALQGSRLREQEILARLHAVLDGRFEGQKVLVRWRPVSKSQM